MSGIAGVFNIPTTPQELSTWSFVHAVHHFDINAAVLTQTGQKITGFILDPFDPTDMEVWLYQHQAMHNVQDAILGIKGYDLTSVNWQDPSSLGGWIQANATEHFQAANILGIG